MSSRGRSLRIKMQRSDEDENAQFSSLSVSQTSRAKTNTAQSITHKTTSLGPV